MPRPILYPQGQRFGRWTILKKSGRTKSGSVLWLCKCECGNERPVEAGHLRKGDSTNCGCVPHKPRERMSIGWVRVGDCFVCTSHRPGTHGYPQIRIDGRNGTIPRLILKRKIGEVNSEILARHTCDNRLCIRPDHIIPGSRTDNRMDAINRNRHAKGMTHYNAILTDEAVHEIRNSGKPAAILANKFGVAKATVETVRNHRSWRHLK